MIWLRTNWWQRYRGATPLAAPRNFKPPFIAATAILIIAAIYTSVLIMRQQTSLQAVSRYNVTWLLSQAAMELARLESVVGTLAVPGNTTHKDDVQLWLDIVYNRVQLFDSGEVADFIRSSQDLLASGNEFRRVIDEIQPLVDSLGQPESVGLIITKLTQLHPKLVRLAAAGNARGTELVNADLAQLSYLHWLFSGLLAGLILCSFTLIAVLSWHNRLLSKAHQEVNGLVTNLKLTSNELSAANRRERQAMTEVQLQNQILQARDTELITQNARFDAALNNMSQALCMADANQQLIVCNVRFLELFELSPGVVQPGTLVADVFRIIAAVGRYDPNLIGGLCEQQQALVLSHSPGKFLQELPNGPALSISHQPMAGGGWVATYEDVTENRHAEARIRFMAHHDKLTSLPNRVHFHDRMADMLNEPSHSNERVAVLYLDLDYFKNVNDTLGHPAGDALLEAVAERLRHCVRDSDVVARLGGDEFAVLQRSVDQPAQAESLAQRIVERLRAPYDLNGHRAIVGVSVGIDIAAKRDTTPEMLMKNADMALYRAKAAGRGTYRFFVPEMDALMQGRRTMELDLREALGRNELEVYYQPIFDLAAGR